MKEFVWTKETVDRFWDNYSNLPVAEKSFGKLNSDGLLELVASEVDASEAIMDFGAGSGEMVCKLIEKGKRVAALEPSEQRLQKLKEKVGALPNAKGEFLGGAGEGDQFDLVFCVEVIEHILDDEFDGAIEALLSYVKPGGRLVVTTPNSEEMEDLRCVCPSCETVFHRFQHQRSFTPEVMIEVFESRGFVCSKVHRYDFSNYGDLHAEYMRMRNVISGAAAMIGPGRSIVSRAKYAALVLAGKIDPERDGDPSNAMISRGGLEDGVRSGAEHTLVFVGRKKDV